MNERVKELIFLFMVIVGIMFLLALGIGSPDYRVYDAEMVCYNPNGC